MSDSNGNNGVSVICGGLTARGTTCNRPCRPGFTRCYMHGGQGPSAKVKAENALALLRMPAIETLYNLLEQFDANTCIMCGYPEGTLKEKRFAAAICKTILDRTGLGPRSTLEIKQTDGDLDLQALRDDEKQELVIALVALRKVKDKIRKRLHDEAFGLTFDPLTHSPDAPDNSVH